MRDPGGWPARPGRVPAPVGRAWTASSSGAVLRIPRSLHEAGLRVRHRLSLSGQDADPGYARVSRGSEARRGVECVTCQPVWSGQFWWTGADFRHEAIRPAKKHGCGDFAAFWRMPPVFSGVKPNSGNCPPSRGFLGPAAVSGQLLEGAGGSGPTCLRWRRRSGVGNR